MTYGGAVALRPAKGAASVVPHSGAQQAGAAGPIGLLKLGSLTLDTFVRPVRDPGVKSFDLKSLYFSLGTDTGNTEGLAQGGTLSITGFDVNGKQIPSQALAYAPEGAQNQPFEVCYFS